MLHHTIRRGSLQQARLCFRSSYLLGEALRGALVHGPVPRRNGRPLRLVSRVHDGLQTCQVHSRFCGSPWGDSSGRRIIPFEISGLRHELGLPDSETGSLCYTVQSGQSASGPHRFAKKPPPPARSFT